MNQKDTTSYLWCAWGRWGRYNLISLMWMRKIQQPRTFDPNRKDKPRTFDLNENDTTSYLWCQWERNNLVQTHTFDVTDKETISCNLIPLTSLRKKQSRTTSYLWRQWERNSLVQPHTFDVNEKETVSYNHIPLTSVRKKQSRTFDVNEKGNRHVSLTWSKKCPWERRQETPVDSPRYKFRTAIPQTPLNQSSVWHNDSVHMYITII